jgi:hypothetical protein
MPQAHDGPCGVKVSENASFITRCLTLREAITITDWNGFQVNGLTLRPREGSVESSPPPRKTTRLHARHVKEMWH